MQADKTKTANFFCPYVRITEETELKARVVKRRENENAYIQIKAITGNPVIVASSKGLPKPSPCVNDIKALTFE